MKRMSGKKSASVIKINIYPDAEDLAREAAQYLTRQIRLALAARERISLMLSGGTTPRDVYAHFANQELAGSVDWSRVLIFWGDERCVPPDHPESNFHMAQQSLLEKVSIPIQNIHRIRGELAPQEAAADYERTLAATLGAGANPPAVDMLLLGMGEDGHIASLFPGSPALQETQRWVVAVPHDEPPPPLIWRVTVTFPLILAARQVVLIVSGQKKSTRLHQALYEREGDTVLPAQRLRQVKGELVWLVDQAAAGAA